MENQKACGKEAVVVESGSIPGLMKAMKILWRREQVSQPRFEPSTSQMRLNGVIAMLTGSATLLIENPAVLAIKKFPSC
jgi:hypothetical protein